MIRFSDVVPGIRTALAVSLCMTLCVLLLQGGCAVLNMQFQRAAIPHKLETDMFYAEGNCGDFTSYQGAQAFRLKASTIIALKAQGIKFFADINAPANRASRAYFHGDWLPTPFPDIARDGPLGNMYCGIAGSWTWPKGLPEAISRPGGYYQTLSGRTLIVLPNEGYIVAVGSDR